MSPATAEEQATSSRWRSGLGRGGRISGRAVAVIRKRSSRTIERSALFVIVAAAAAAPVLFLLLVLLLALLLRPPISRRRGRPHVQSRAKP